MDKELLDAINKLSATIDSMNSAMGVRRTGGRAAAGNNANRLGQANAGAGNFQKQLDEMSKGFSGSAKAITKQAKELNDQLNESSASAKKTAKSLDTLTAAEKKAKAALEDEASARKDAIKGLGSFSKELLLGTSDLQGGLKGLGSSLGTASKSMGGVAGVITRFGAALASGAGFTLGFMNSVVRASSEISGAVDLRTLSSGFIATQKLFSSLGDSFSKVVNESAGSFRFFGKNNEEAIANLGRLSRAFRTGLGTSDIARSLGRDLEPALRQATDATNALGLSQDEQASLMASIMQTSRIGATSEQDAQRRLVQQYSDTVKSARDLSNAFGTSARDMLRVMQEFSQSAIGQGAQRQGIQGAGDVAGILSSLGIQASPETLQAMAAQLAAGETGAALGTAQAAGLDPATINSLGNIGEVIDQMRRQGREVNAQNLTEALRQNAGQLQERMFNRDIRYTTDAEGIRQYTAEQRMRTALEQLGRPPEAPGAPGGRAGRGTEADTQRQVNTVNTLTDGLKGMFTGLAAGVLATLGPLGLLAAASTIAAISLGRLGGANGILGGLANMLGGRGAAGGIAGAAGAAGGIAGAASGAGRAAAGAGAAGGLGASISGIIGGIGEGVARALPAIGAGIAGFFQAIGNPAVVKAAVMAGVAIAGFISLVGVGIGAALAVAAGGLYLFSKSLVTFNDINSDNLTKVGSGLKDLGIGMLAFGAAMIANAAGGVVNAVAGFFGGDIITRIKKAIDDLTPSLPVLEKLGPAMKDFGTGLAAFTTAVGSLGRGKVSEFMNEFQNSLIGIRAGFFAQFGEGMLKFGNGMKAFGEAIAGIDADKMARVMALLQESARNIDTNALRSLGESMLSLPAGQQLGLQQSRETATAAGTLSGFNPEADPRFQQYYQEELRNRINPTDVQQQQEAREDAANRLRLERLSTGTPQTPATATLQNLENFSQLLATQNTQSTVGRTTVSEPSNDQNSLASDPFKKLVAEYLTTLVDDISAIRGNTRPDVSSMTPVRLS